MNLQHQTPSPTSDRTIIDTVEIAAPTARVLAALTTAEGLRAWWTQDCEMTATEATFGFRPKARRISSTLRVDRRDARGIAMTCTASEGMGWLGTRLAFAVEPAGDRTRVTLTHAGFATSDCQEECTRGWRYFLASLVALLETGTGTPYTTCA